MCMGLTASAICSYAYKLTFAFTSVAHLIVQPIPMNTHLRTLIGTVTLSCGCYNYVDAWITQHMNTQTHSETLPGLHSKSSSWSRGKVLSLILAPVSLDTQKHTFPRHCFGEKDPSSSHIFILPLVQSSSWSTLYKYMLQYSVCCWCSAVTNQHHIPKRLFGQYHTSYELSLIVLYIFPFSITLVLF